MADPLRPTLPPHDSTVTQARQAGASAPVARAIAEAAAKTGVDFSYMLAKAGIESSFDPDIKARTSSARGLYQFIDETWLIMVKRHGAEHGLEAEAAAIRIGARGRAVVPDAAMRRQILALRDDPQISALMAAEFTGDNQEMLQASYRGPVGATELYFAHFLGAVGAAKFLNAWAATPDRNAAALFPKAARANRPTFYHPNGRPRTLAEVYRHVEGKLDGFGPEHAVTPPSAAATQGKAGGILAEIGTRAVLSAPGVAAALRPVTAAPRSQNAMVVEIAPTPVEAPAPTPAAAALIAEVLIPPAAPIGRTGPDGSGRMAAFQAEAPAGASSPAAALPVAGLRPFSTLTPAALLLLARLPAPGETQSVQREDGPAL